jgi:hypothetical protein
MVEMEEEIKNSRLWGLDFGIFVDYLLAIQNNTEVIR